MRSTKVDIQTGNNTKCTSTDPTQYPYTQQLSQIYNILQIVQKNHIDGADSVLDNGSCSMKTVKLFQKFHAWKDIQEKFGKKLSGQIKKYYLTIDSVLSLIKCVCMNI